jgi:hypothetical protein
MVLGGLEGSRGLAGVVRDATPPVGGAPAESARPNPNASASTPLPAPAGGTTPIAESVPSEAPPGTDPALWRVLTAAERSFFMQSQALGPLTYRPGAGDGSAAPALRGGRIDVRV